MTTSACVRCHLEMRTGPDALCDACRGVTAEEIRREFKPRRRRTEAQLDALIEIVRRA